jgi:cell division protein FtsQ
MKKIYNLMKIVFMFAVLLLGIHLFSNFLTQYNYFSVKKYDIQGVDVINKKNLENYCNSLMLDNIFLIRFKKLDDFHSEWVKKVSFKKIYPDKILLNVYERKPLFRINENNHCYYLTDDLIRIKSDCENINVFAEDTLSNDQLLAFADIYKHFKEHFDFIKLYNSYFKAYVGNTQLIGTYDKDFLSNYKAYCEKIDQLYKNIERADLRVNGKIYIKGDLNGA